MNDQVHMEPITFDQFTCAFMAIKGRELIEEFGPDLSPEEVAKRAQAAYATYTDVMQSVNEAFKP